MQRYFTSVRYATLLTVIDALLAFCRPLSQSPSRCCWVAEQDFGNCWACCCVQLPPSAGGHR
ncbi:hypothetical protein MJ575_21390 [Klebsiella pneumoniae]|nr:hypothetical protein MJ575_21390 [Klebsiella pneumoniae]